MGQEVHVQVGLGKVCVGEVQCYSLSLFMSFKHNGYLGLVIAFSQVPLLNRLSFLSFAPIPLSSFVNIAK